MPDDTKKSPGAKRTPEETAALAEQLKSIRAGTPTPAPVAPPMPATLVPTRPESADDAARRILGRPADLPDLADEKTVAARLMERAIENAREPAADAASSDGIDLGVTETKARVFLGDALRNRHLYIIGKTRTGKTTLMTNIMKRDIRLGRGVCFIDPHGDAADDLLNSIAPKRHADVLYFDPSSPTAPAFNPLRLVYPPAKLTEDLLSTFKMFFGESWGPRMEHILRYAFLALLADPEPHCLADLKTLLLDTTYRARVISRLAHPALRDYWREEFSKAPSNAVQPIVNKLSAFLAPMSDLERVFSETHNDIDFTEVLDGKILIVNLAKGKIGEEPSRLLGGLFAACIQQAALARATIAEADRKHFYFFADEFQNYVVPSFESILAESAKYRVNLTLAHQDFGQIPGSLRAAIFGNVATYIAFQISADDAGHLAREMRRTRIRVRKRSTAEWQPLYEFLEEHAHYAETYPEAQAILQGNPYFGDAEWKRQHWQFIIKAFEAMTFSPPSVPALRRAFNEIGGGTWEFQEYVFPEVEDFPNLANHHAFIRRERAENVVRFRSNEPDMQSFDAANRRALVELFARQAEERRRATEIKQQILREAAATETAVAPLAAMRFAAMPLAATPLIETGAPVDATRSVEYATAPTSTVQPEPAPRPEPLGISIPYEPHEIVAPAPIATEPSRAAEPKPAPKPKKPTPLQPALLGKGGAKHKYLQDFIRRMAESKGFRAVIEEPVLDGTGSIDVALYRGERKIACEISVSSTAGQERSNVAKCQAAGYPEVLVIAAETKDIRKLRAIGDGQKILVLKPEEFVEYLDASPPTEPVTEEVVRGYRVKTRWKPTTSADAEVRRRQISTILVQGLKRLKEPEA